MKGDTDLSPLKKISCCSSNCLGCHWLNRFSKSIVLIDDIGKVLGCGAVMTKLVRTSAAGFDLADSVTISQLQSLRDADKIDKLNSYVLSVEEILKPYPEIVVSDGQAQRFKNGGSLSLTKLKGCKENGFYRVKSALGEFIGLGEADISNDILRFRRIYNER